MDKEKENKIDVNRSVAPNPNQDQPPKKVGWIY